MAGIEAVRPFSQTLPEGCGEAWTRATRHPFMAAVADGSLEPAAFHVWIQQDRHFVEGLRRFVTELIAVAPDDDGPGLQSGLAALESELELFRAYAETARVRLDVPVMPVCDEYVRFLRSCIGEGYAVALTAYYACERAYFEAWSSAGTGGPYTDWIDNWTSEPFRAYVGWLGSRVDERALSADERTLRTTFRRAVVMEIAFWDACG